MDIVFHEANWISPTLFIGTIVATFIVATIFRRIFRRYILKSTDIIKRDPTKYSFVGHIITALIYCVGFGFAIMQVDSLKAYASSILAGAGILAVAVGFASQQSLSNVISGLFIVIFRPYKIMDRITISNLYSGTVEDITLRHTVIRDFENRRIVIPNSIISNETVINADLADQRMQKWIEFSISYDSDIDLAKKIIRDYIINHPFHIDGRSQEQIDNGVDEVPIRVVSLGDSSVNIRAWCWAKDVSDAFVMACDSYENVKKKFDQSGIEIPFPHRTIVEKKTHEKKD